MSAAEALVDTLMQRCAALEAEVARLRARVCDCCGGNRSFLDGHPACCSPGCGCWGRCSDPTCCEPDEPAGDGGPTR